jgi:L-lactate dehydrogenase complex protein LldF
LDDHYEKLKNRVAEALQNDLINTSRKRALNAIREKHLSIENEIDVEALKVKFRKIKSESISNLPSLLSLAERRLKENGCQIYYASTSQDVNHILDELVDEPLVVKCKSNTSKEIGLLDYLQSRNIEVIETDLGDRIVQLSQTHPSHPLIPSLHVPKAQAAQLFGIAKDPAHLTIKDIVNEARAGLRELVLKCNISISGANAIAAEEGLICLEENEGNQRLITSLTRKHIVLAGIDKVVSTAEDAIHIMKAAAYFGLAQRTGVYLSFIAGPSKTGDIDFQLTYGMHGPEEVHVIFIDNGRGRLIDAGYGELLYCASCGGCATYCPVYEQIGDAFGSKTEIGGRGLLYLSHTQNTQDAFQNGLNYCTGCQACTVACPGSINTYDLMRKIRSEAIAKDCHLPVHAKILASIQEQSNPSSENQAQRSTWLHGSSNMHDQKTETLLFIGCMSSYRVQSQAKSVFSLLERLNIPFTYLGTDEPCCGSVLRNIGFDIPFQEIKAKVQEKIKPFSQIITICPGCYSTFKTAYAEFLQQNNIEVKHLIEILPSYTQNFKSHTSKITYHDPCHLGRHFSLYDPPRTLFQDLQLDFQEMTFTKDKARCCGAGAGVLSAFPNLAKIMAKSRIDEAEQTNCEEIITSCPFCAYNLSQASETIPVRSIQEFLLDKCIK